VWAWGWCVGIKFVLMGPDGDYEAKVALTVTGGEGRIGGRGGEDSGGSVRGCRGVGLFRSIIVWWMIAVRAMTVCADEALGPDGDYQAKVALTVKCTGARPPWMWHEWSWGCGLHGQARRLCCSWGSLHGRRGHVSGCEDSTSSHPLTLLLSLRLLP
jgi:hypothetical protein